MDPIPAGPALHGVHSFGALIEDAFTTTSNKIKEAVTSPVGQQVIGFGLGVGMHKITIPLTLYGIKNLGATTNLDDDPFRINNLATKILLAPFVCVIGPITEEQLFRRDLQDRLQDQLEDFYLNQNFSVPNANTAARVTSIFFTSVVFGLLHFTNAIAFRCNPILFLPQVVHATIVGLLFSLAKEFSGELHIPIGMHIGNNTIAWAHYIKESL